MKPIHILFLLCFLTGFSQTRNAMPKQRHYEAEWESLAQYDETAEWFKDAKFGIYAHWGVLAVPAYANDWYPRNMHIVGTDEYKHHVATYGEPSKFGYHDFVPLFKAEQFDANAWVDLFVQAGAKFAGIVAEHHDGWSNWNSTINPWNSMKMGPHRDIVGELSKAIHGRGLKLVTSFHKDRNLQLFQQDATKWLDDTSYFPYNPNMPTSSTDPLLRILYGNIPKEQFYKNWLGELKELIDNYSPDLIYFDSKMAKIPDSLKRQFVAYYFNNSVKQKKQVVITHKEGELPKSVSVEDLEKGRMNNKTSDFWLTDETVSIGSWSYTNDLALKSPDEIIDLLADIVSKNGVLMLNVSPMANGIIPQNQQHVLLDIGKWLNTNGEAIYSSRTWQVFGEGPTKQEKSGMFVDKITYNAKDIRYTTKGNIVYAIILGWPGNNTEVVLTSFTEKVLGKKVPEITGVSILGYGGKVKYNVDDKGLHFTTPDSEVDGKAFVVKIVTEQ